MKKVGFVLFSMVLLVFFALALYILNRPVSSDANDVLRSRLDDKDFIEELVRQNTGFREERKEQAATIAHLQDELSRREIEAAQQEDIIAQLTDRLEEAQSAPIERASPHDRIVLKDIRVYSDRIVIYVHRPIVTSLVDSNSEDPLFDVEANILSVEPEAPQDIHVGDIMSYAPSFYDGEIVHRVVAIGQDEEGWFAVAKGDNNPSPDPGKIRFTQVKRVVIGIIY
ncbi:MAG: hypothetical protein ABIH41_01270 [Nanoarchaeota archaeon]